MDNITTKDKPDLKNKSVVFPTVANIALGAVIGAALTLVTSAIPPLRFRGAKSFTEAFKNEIARDVMGVSIMSGLIGYADADAKNKTKDQIRPYVEKLEADRNRLADLVLNGSGVQKG